MIFLWQIGVIDGLTFMNFCANCAAQYTGITLAELPNYTGPSVFLAPVQGLAESYKYIRAAKGANEIRKRAATVASFMMMSGAATLTDPATNAAAGGTIVTFIGHMRDIIAKANSTSTGGLVFANSALLSKLTKDELFVLNVVIVGGVLLIVVSCYVLPRIAKAYWNYSKKVSQYIKTYGKKVFLPFKYVGFIKRRLIKLKSSILVRNKIL